uniref:Interleukin-1 n=1 Tax=Gopherus agassizii TaxID=38772 RepID=A0A452IVS4_9SAUR
MAPTDPTAVPSSHCWRSAVAPWASMGQILWCQLVSLHCCVGKMVSVVPNRTLERKRCPLILGIKGGSQGLSCGTAEQPQLQLEDMHLIDLFYQDEEAKRFTFFKTYNGSTHRFEAAAYPGWFLCTSTQANEPISLTTRPGETAITDFYFQPK